MDTLNDFTDFSYEFIGIHDALSLLPSMLIPDDYIDFVGMSAKTKYKGKIAICLIAVHKSLLERINFNSVLQEITESAILDEVKV